MNSNCRICGQPIETIQQPKAGWRVAHCDRTQDAECKRIERKKRAQLRRA